MTLCGDTLLCNFPKCRIKLSGFAWVTACSHVFCDQHGSGEFSRTPAICPACSSALSGKLDIVRTELSPSEDYKAMVLAGLRPDVVLEISSRALAFWTYQVNILLFCTSLLSHQQTSWPLFIAAHTVLSQMTPDTFLHHSNLLAHMSTTLFDTPFLYIVHPNC